MTVQNLIYRFTLDTFKNGVQRILQGFQTGESVSRKMIISLVSGSESYELPLSNITATMYVKRPSQESPSINACAIDSENNAILYDILNEDIAEAGIVEMQLKIIDSISGKVLISPKFGMEVWESNIDDSDAEESPTYTALETALAQATAMKDSAIAELYIDDDNVFTVVFGDGTTYTSTVIADAIGRIDSVEEYALKSEGFAVGEQNGVPVASESPYYQNNAKYYAESAGTSASNASASEQNAATSEANASASETNAATSEANALASETNAATSETNASASATSASTSATNAAISEANALASEQNASASETNAATSETNAATSEANASTSETNAATSETNALAYSKTSQSYAVGGSGTRQGEDSDNAKYYKEVCEQIAGGLEGGFIPMGTILFEALPTASQDKKGWMYNISDEFVTDARFKDGSGKRYAAGTNVYLTADMLWDCLSGVVPTVNGKNGNSITLDGSDILVTGYTEASTESAIAPSDSINTSLGKLEKKADNNKSSVSSLESRATSLEGRATSLEGRASTLETSVGNTSNLTTTSKVVVGAINEHDAEIGDASKVADRIGSFFKLNYEITEGELRITYEDYQKVINDEPIVIKGLVVQDYVNEIDYTYCVLAAENFLHIYETESSQSYINISGVQWELETTDLSSKIQKNQEGIRSLNSNLTQLQILDFAQTSVPVGTSFNAVVQMLMEKVFPKTWTKHYDNGSQMGTDTLPFAPNHIEMTLTAASNTIKCVYDKATSANTYSQYVNNVFSRTVQMPNNSWDGFANIVNNTVSYYSASISNWSDITIVATP